MTVSGMRAVRASSHRKTPEVAVPPFLRTLQSIEVRLTAGF
jgi:hypothetical protein